MKKILHVSETVTGGVATYLNILLDERFMKYRNRVIVPDSQAHHINGQRCIRTFHYPRRSIVSTLRLVIVSVREYYSYRPDLVFCHSTFALAPLLVIRAIFWKSRIVYCAHGWAGAREIKAKRMNRIIRHIEGLLCSFSDIIINVSNNDLDFAKVNGYYGNHTVIKNTVQAAAPNARDDLFSSEPELLHILFVGRMDHQKGLDILLEAFRKARNLRADLRLHIVGAQVLGDTAFITPPCGASFIGWIDRERIDDWYRSADALIVPSRWEGFGLVVPEALRNGTPVLVSNRSGLPSLVQEGVTGLVFPLHTADLSEFLLKLDKCKLRAMRAEAFSSYEAYFNLDHFYSEMNDLLRSVAND